MLQPKCVKHHFLSLGFDQTFLTDIFEALEGQSTAYPLLYLGFSAE